MRIAILGSGLMGSALGAAWAREGHDVAFSYSRDRGKLEKLARDAGPHAAAAAPNDAVAGAEVVLVSVPWHRLDDALDAAGGASAFAGKVVISCSMPMLPDDSDLAIGHETSGAEELARRLTNARVVAAFNTIPSELIRPALLFLTGERLQVVICGDDEDANDIAGVLADDVGLTPVNAGPLRVSRWIEPFGLLVAQLAYTQSLGPALGYKFFPEVHDEAEQRASRLTPPFVIARHNGILEATVWVYARDNLDRSGFEVEQFRRECLNRLTPGMAFGSGAGEVQSGMRAPIGTFTFGPEHRPLPMEEILEWLRGLPIVRLIEIEYHRRRQA